MVKQKLRKRLFEPFKPANRRDNKEAMKEFFLKRLQKTVNANQHRKKPYFITYKLKFDMFKPWIARDIMLVHEEVPLQMVAGTVLYTVDNEKGICDLVRVVEP